MTSPTAEHIYVILFTQKQTNKKTPYDYLEKQFLKSHRYVLCCFQFLSSSFTPGPSSPRWNDLVFEILCFDIKGHVIFFFFFYPSCSKQVNRFHSPFLVFADLTYFCASQYYSLDCNWFSFNKWWNIWGVINLLQFDGLKFKYPLGPIKLSGLSRCPICTDHSPRCSQPGCMPPPFLFLFFFPTTLSIKGKKSKL